MFIYNEKGNKERDNSSLKMSKNLFNNKYLEKEIERYFQIAYFKLIIQRKTFN